jgi:hypothetical protein
MFLSKNNMAEKPKKQKRGKFFVVPQTDEEIERNRKIIEELRARRVLQKYEKTFRIEKDGEVVEE